jgi:non-specific serine/threonine protein kinase
VATLVGQGKSNAEIAATLFVGLRTVEAHVTHILNKLGFNSRTQIAAWISRETTASFTGPLDDTGRTP